MFGITDNRVPDTATTDGPPPMAPPPMPGDMASQVAMPNPMVSAAPATDPSGYSYEPVTSPAVTPDVVAPTMPIPTPSAVPMPDPMAMPVPADPMATPMPTAIDPPDASTYAPTETYGDSDASTPPGSTHNGPIADDDKPKITSNYDSKTGLGPATPPENEDELLEIKKQALESLAPLVDELEQTPEEHFKTTMMLIQASDNADLVKEAFSAANAISDEKARAQALLDVVNEINYFTQPHDN